MFNDTTLEAPAFSAPTLALPTSAPARLKSTVEAGEAAEPIFWTVAFSVIAVNSLGEAGVQFRAVMVRSGLGAMVPMIWNSATCPEGAPLLAVKLNCTALAVADTGIVTVLAFVVGLKLYVADDTRFENVLVVWLCDSTWKVCVLAAQIGSGFSFTTMLVIFAFAVRSIVSVLG